MKSRKQLLKISVIDNMTQKELENYLNTTV